MTEVSPATYQRLENGGTPDLDTYFKLCRWLKVSLNHFAVEVIKNKSTIHPCDYIVAYIHGDKQISHDTRNALSHMVKLVYKREYSPSKEKDDTYD